MEEELNNYSSALSDLDIALSIDPKCLECLLTRAELYSEAIKDYDRAIDDYSHILDINPHNVKVRLLRARLFSKIRNFKLEMNDYITIIQFIQDRMIYLTDLEYANVLYKKAMLHLDLGEEYNARETFQEALRYNERFAVKKWWR
jgi:tetratricopeptide (TPR) repeat protein